jgi:hypothetical protein
MTMGDKKKKDEKIHAKQQPPAKQELTEQELDQVAGGCVPEAAAQNPAGPDVSQSSPVRRW